MFTEQSIFYIYKFSDQIAAAKTVPYACFFFFHAVAQNLAAVFKAVFSMD